MNEYDNGVAKMRARDDEGCCAPEMCPTPTIGTVSSDTYEMLKKAVCMIDSILNYIEARPGNEKKEETPRSLRENILANANCASQICLGLERLQSIL